MAITIEATYEDGVLKPQGPLPLNDHDRVQITIEPTSSWAEQTAGIIRWTGDVETLERLAMAPEFDPQESG